MPARAPILALLLAAAPAHAQNCIWNYISPPAKTAPPARSFTALAFDSSRNHIVLYGGHSATLGTLADTWAWDGSGWLRHLTSGPGSRTGHAIAYDPVRQRTILFGGSRGHPPDTRTWQLDAAGWSALPAINTIHAVGHVIIHDPKHQRTILVGDLGPAAPTTWELDATGLWLPLPIPGPSPRQYAAAAYDSHRSRIILYGGRAGDTILSDLWEFDGSGAGSWTVIGNGPTPRYAAAAAYDPVRRRFVISGGITSDQAWGLTDTSELDPATGAWTTRADDGPGGRAGAAMIFDAARSAVLHFGGGAFPYGIQSNELFRFDGAGTLAVLVRDRPSFQTLAPGQPLTLHGLGENATDYQWIRNQHLLFNGGPISGAHAPTLVINPVTTCDGGYYILTMTCGCGTADPGALISMPPACYANCDNSTLAPVLTANDLMCFLNKFAQGDCYANCDHSVFTPTLTASDFACFLSAYTSGCS